MKKKTNKKTLSETKKSIIEAYRKARRNILNQYNSMLKRGYKFSKNPIPKIPKDIEEASIRNIKKKQQGLYKKAWAVDETGLNTISGEEKRQQEIKERNIKASQTRKSPERVFEREIKKRETDILYRMKADVNYNTKLNLGEIVYNRMLQAIQDASTEYPKTAQYLLNKLEQEISKYGRNETLANIANAPETLIEKTFIALHYNLGDVFGKQPNYDDAINSINEIIDGAKILTSEQKEIDRLMRKDVGE